jgi:hypothetical protein
MICQLIESLERRDLFSGSQQIEVENDETHWVGHDRAAVVATSITIGGGRTENVGQNESLHRNQGLGQIAGKP